jgi:D-alanyl-D-alanine carboxypeptidase
VRIRWSRVVAVLLVVAAAIIALVGRQAPGSSTRTLAQTLHITTVEPRRALGAADGAVPDGTTVFADEVPGVAKLDPALLDALRQAASRAANDGITLTVDSGWRSPEYQRQLLRDAIAKYGSEAEASRWVATPDTSEHVSGHAVDIGPSGAAAWLAEHAAEDGLCRIYGNEPWHYELRPEAGEHGCPPTYADPTHDPRMQK